MAPPNESESIALLRPIERVSSAALTLRRDLAEERLEAVDRFRLGGVAIGVATGGDALCAGVRRPDRGG